MLTESTRKEQKDKKIENDLADVSLDYSVFVRLGAKKRRFTKVSFKYCIFDTSYLRDCMFDACDFTGCRFLASNLHGSTFLNCTFDYAVFERTTVDPQILETGCPKSENLRLRFARTLRMNFQQIGDARSVNKAIAIELRSTNVHLYNSWKYNRTKYYQEKYPGWQRLRQFVDWLRFKGLDLLWGNGESASKLLMSMLTFLCVMAILATILFKDWTDWRCYWQAIVEAPQVFLGATPPQPYWRGFISVHIFARLVAFALFMSIVIKRLSRR